MMHPQIPRCIRSLAFAAAACLVSCVGADPSIIACANDGQCSTGYFCGENGFCKKAEVTVDAGTTDGGSTDAGAIDAGQDGGPADAGTDGGPADSGTDGGPADSGTDGGPADSGTDGGLEDGGPTDAGVEDAGTDGGVGETDAGPDAGSTGETDAGATDAGLDAGAADAGLDAGAADAGTMNLSDAGTTDAGPGLDGGLDAGSASGGMDAGATDAGPGLDGGPDAGSASGGTDAGATDAGRLNLSDAGPLITNPQVSANVFSAHSGWNEIVVTFDVPSSLDNAPASLSVTLEGASFSCGTFQPQSPSYSCTYSVTGSEAEGAQTIAIDGVDATGTQGSASLPVTLDFTPPSLLSDGVTPIAARLGETQTLTLMASEPLAGAPTLDISGANPPVFTLTGGTTYAYTHTVAAGDTSAAYESSVTMSDLVGNAATVAGPSFGIDEVVPTISSVHVNAATFSAVQGFNQVAVTFNTAKSLSGSTLVATIGTADMECGTVLAPPPDYSCFYTVTGTEAAGTQTISLTATDEAGNTSTASATVTFDFTPPSVVSSSATPTVVGLTQTETLSLTASESLSAPPALVVSGAGAPAFTVGSGNQGTTYSFTHVVSGSDAPGLDQVNATLTDLVGNQATAPVGSFTIDNVVPTISSVTTNAMRFSAVSGFNQVVVTFDTPKSLGLPGSSLAVKIGSAPMNCQPYSATAPNYSCSYPVTGTETAGTQTITLTATDEAGNTNTGSAMVFFDFTPPSIVSSSATPAVVGLAQTETVALTASESLSATPILVVSGAGAPVFTSGSGNTGTTYSFTHVIGGSDAPGLDQVNTTLIDLVGNQATLSAGSFTIDNVVPTISSVTTNATTFSAVSGFNQLLVTFTTAKSVDLAGSSLVATVGSAAMTCGSYSATAPNYSCSYLVKGTETAGLQTVSLTATDEAGNTRTGSAAVVFDFTPPSLVTTSAAPGIAGLGQTETVSFMTSESLSVTPTLTVSGAGAPAFTLNAGSSGTTYSFGHPVSGSDVDGLYQVSTTLTDLVGNAATLSVTTFTIDKDTPAISSVMTNATRFSTVSGFNQVIVVFDTTKSLNQSGSSLVVTIGSEPMTCQTYSATPPNYSCSYTVTGSEPAGTQTISITATDEASNKSTASTTVVFDFTPPSLLSSSATPAIVGLGQTELVALNPSETLLAPPTLVLSGVGSPAFTLTAGSMYFYTHVVSSSDTNGLDDVAVTLTDLAGNTAMLPVGSFTIDNVVPTISSVMTNATRFSAVHGFNQVVVTFDTAKSADTVGSGLAVMIGSASMTCGSYSASQPNYTCTYTVKGTETEGMQTISLTAGDEAGNMSTASTSVTFDFTPPSLTSSSATPSVCRPGVTETIALAVSEALSAAPTITITGSGSPTFTLSGGTTYSFTHAVTGSDATGYYQSSVTLTDLVGNAATRTGPSYSVDAIVPNIYSVMTNRTHFSTVSGYNQVVLTFDTTKSLDTAGSSLVAMLGAAAMTCGTYSSSAPNYTCTYDVAGTETEGTQTISMTATDEAGNMGTATTSVVFDFTPPTLSADSASPAVARAGVTVTVALTPSEALLSTPSLMFSGPGTPVFTLTGGTTYSFTHVVTSSDATGTYGDTVTMTDLAGNMATVAGPGFSFDTTVPTISSVATNETRFSAVSGYNNVLLTFNTAKSLDTAGSTLAVTLGTKAMTCGTYSATAPSYSCSYFVTGSEAEGAHTISISATDEAGNTSTGSTSVTFDFTPPAFTSDIISPAAAKQGTVETLTFTVTEALSATPTVVCSGPIVLGFTAVAQTQYQFQYTVQAGNDGSYTTTVKMTDLVGNTATLTGPSFTIDTVVPTVTSLAVNASTFSAVSGYNTVTATFHTAKSVSTSGSFLTATIGSASMACGPYSSGTVSYTCTYQVTGHETAGANTLQVVAIDEAGNTSSASTSITFDFTPPSLRTDTATPSTAVIGDVESIALTASETLAATPTLTVSGPAMPTFTLTAASTYTFTHSVTYTDTTGSYTTTVGMTDLVGNTATVTGPSFAFSIVPDSATTSTFVASPTSAKTGGATVTLTVTLKDASGNLLRNRTVALSSTGTENTFSPSSGTTNTSGVFTATMSSNQPELKTLSATTNYETLKTTVTFKTLSCSGTTSFGTQIDTTAYGSALDLADFNEDGLIDAVYATSTGVAVAFGNGNGTFQTALVTTVANIGTVSWVTAYDFNRDGYLDVAIVGSVGPVILLGNGNGTFRSTTLPTTGTGAFQLAVGDLNNDGYADLVTLAKQSTPQVLLGNGDGTFGSQANVGTGNDLSVVVSDFNHDGNLDLATNDNKANKVDIYLGNGNGTFQTDVAYTAGQYQDTGLAAADLNNDGYADLVSTAAGPASIGTLLNDQTGKFTLKGDPAITGVAFLVATGDLNGDGNVDVLTGLSFGGGVAVVLGNGDGSFQTATAYYPQGGTSGLPFAVDLNNDGRPDLVYMLPGEIIVGLNVCSP